MDTVLTSNIKTFADPDALEARVKKVLALAAQQGATQAEVGAAASMGLNVTARLGEVETVEFNRDKGTAITVYIGHQKGTASTSDTSDAALQAAVKAAIDIARFSQGDPAAGLADPELMAKHIPSLDLYHPWDLQAEEAIALAIETENAARQFDKRIVNSDGASVSTHQSYHVYGNSHGFIGGYPTSRHSMSCVVIASDETNRMERSYDYSVNRNYLKLEKGTLIGANAAQKTLRKLNGKQIATQKIPVIFDATVADSLWNHLIAAISGGNLYRKSTFLLDAKGESIFPNYINVWEKPHMPARLGSAPFDSDGIATQEKQIIHAGCLETYILSAYSGRKLGMKSTGNAGGVHNIVVESTMGTLPDMLKQMGRGLLVTELMGQGINITTGDYSRGASGFWVENGEIQFPVHEVTIAGNLKTMFQNIMGVGQDIDERGNVLTGSILINEMSVAGK